MVTAWKYACGIVCLSVLSLYVFLGSKNTTDDSDFDGFRCGDDNHTLMMMVLIVVMMLVTLLVIMMVLTPVIIMITLIIMTM